MRDADLLASALSLMSPGVQFILMPFHDLHPSLAGWLAEFEIRLATLFAGEFPLLHEACITTVASPGKRIRPIMLLLSCATFGEVTPRAIDKGCLVELIHSASLVHDDVVDEADTRRGVLSARARWNNKFSVLLGDFLLARIFELATEDGDPRILQLLASAATAMGRGVILELSTLNLDADEEIYWQVVAGKTAALFAAAAAMGALLGGADRRQERAMARMGDRFGHAFQLADDLLDLSGSETETGKPLAIDWQQQRATLPLLYALHRVDPVTAARIRELWQQEPFTIEHFFALRLCVEQAGGFEYGWGKVKEYLDEAGAVLQGMPTTAARDALLHLCQEGFPLPVLPSMR